jgi:putative ubiquitin-RnfH superfamily antitoxin RatB of RatAB toxin-antitoxin module
MKVDVVYALPTEQYVREVELPNDATVNDALNASGVLEKFPDVGAAASAGELALGIFGERVTQDSVLEDGDRVEIYRTLIYDPKEIRRRRARKRR